MKAPTRHAIDAIALRALKKKAARLASLSHELYVLAAVLSPPPSRHSDSATGGAAQNRERAARKRQRIHVALLLENGLIDQDGKPPGWTVEADIAEEQLALSELSALRRSS